MALKGELKMTNKTREALKAEFIENRGYWSSFWEDVLELDETFFSAYFYFIEKKYFRKLLIRVFSSVVDSVNGF